MTLIGLILLVHLVGCEGEQQTVRPTVNVYQEGAPFSTQRDFDVSEGEFGHLGVFVLEQMQDRFPYRLAFSDRELEAALWIEALLVSLGFDEEQIEFQNFDINTPTSSWWGEAISMVEMYEQMGDYDNVKRIDTSQNVILTMPGQTDETIIIGAHYDGVGNPGISDNAAGVALLIETAYRLKDLDHYYTLQFVFFGAEEVGLIGSFYFADSLTDDEIDRLVLVVNADVILDGPDLIYGVAYVIGDPQRALWGDINLSFNEVTDLIDDYAALVNRTYNTSLIRLPEAITLPSDQLAFLQFSVPTMNFFGTHPTPDGMLFAGEVLHTPNDDLDFIMENMPGRIEVALDTFGRFLTKVLLSEL